MPRATSAPLIALRRTVRAERSSAAGCVGVASLWWPRGGCPNRRRGRAFARLLRRPPGHGRDECFSRASRLPGRYWPPGRRLFSGTECSLAPSKLAARALPPASPLAIRPRPRTILQTGKMDRAKYGDPKRGAIWKYRVSGICSIVRGNTHDERNAYNIDKQQYTNLFGSI